MDDSSIEERLAALEERNLTDPQKRLLCRLIDHAWEMASFGFKYDPNWKGGGGPPPIVSSWRGECRRCGKHRYENDYDEPVSVQEFVRETLT